jgi:hypothetical protein
MSRSVASIGLGDPRAALDLGLLNVRYVVVHDRDNRTEISRLLAAQPPRVSTRMLAPTASNTSMLSVFFSSHGRARKE